MMTNLRAFRTGNRKASRVLPLPCVSRVAGANLRIRIEESCPGIRPSSSRRIGLAAAGVAALLAVFVVGAPNAPVVQAESWPSAASGAPVEVREKFEVVSVKACRENVAPVRKGERKNGSGQGASPGRLGDVFLRNSCSMPRAHDILREPSTEERRYVPYAIRIQSA
jgi:hypothetical protein